MSSGLRGKKLTALLQHKPRLIIEAHAGGDKSNLGFNQGIIGGVCHVDSAMVERTKSPISLTPRDHSSLDS